MTSKKPGFFAGLFGRKKGYKESDPSESNRDSTFYRTQSVRGSSRHQRASRYHEDPHSPEYPNPYHGNVKPRMHPKGPQSCPGGYKEEPYHYDESFDENRTVYQGRGHARHDKFGNRRSARDTSEYGSGDPSPIANFAHHRHNYTASVADDSDPDDYDKYTRESDMAKEYERMKHRLEYVSQRHMYYKTQCRQLKSNKEETERAFNDRVKSLKAENKELRESNGKLKAQISQMTADFNQTTYHPQQSYFPTPSMFAGPFSQPPYRPPHFNALGMPMSATMVTSTVTPGTSSNMESSTGAGEALVLPGDMSFRPTSAQFDSSFSTHQEEDEDDIKDFSSREHDTLEHPRGDVSSSSLGIVRHHEVHLVRQCNDSHASSGTMVADSPSPCPPMKSGSGSIMRRTASDGVLN